MSIRDTRRLTIVSGLPRSGTSMMMRMLSEGGLVPLIDNVRTADEDNPLGYYEFEPVKRTKEDPSWLDDAGGKVVKMVYRLLYDLPADRHYDVIFMKRRLQEVVASQDVMLARRGKQGGSLPPDKLISLFEQQLGEFDAWVAKQANFRVLQVSYNELLATPAPIVEQVNTFLGGVLDGEAMLRVIKPDLYRQRANP